MIKDKKFWKRTFEFVLGCLIVSIGYNAFIAPNKLVPKGVGGIAIILNSIFGWNNSLVILVINCFLLIISLIFLGKDKTKATIFGSLLFPAFVKLTENINVIFQMESTELFLAAIFGGIIYGVGTGLIFRAGFTSGGTDILNQIVSKYGKTSMGKGMIFTDGIIVILSGVFLGINTMLYSIVSLLITSLMADKVVLGISDNKEFFIITDKEEEVKDYIMNDLKHGVTIFRAKGGFNKENETVLMTVLPTKSYYHLKEGIRKIDKDAFYIITDTYEVFGGE